MAGVPLRLLVVEDDDSIRTALRWALEDEGYDVAEAASGEEAVRAVGVAAPDLMVVDLMLGSMDGYAVIREVRRDRDLPIIVVSARADTHDIVAALEAGTTWINAYNLTPVEAPFGGVKRSGIGRENGRAALEHWSRVKSVYVATGPVEAPF